MTNALGLELASLLAFFTFRQVHPQKNERPSDDDPQRKLFRKEPNSEPCRNHGLKVTESRDSGSSELRDRKSINCLRDHRSKNDDVGHRQTHGRREGAPVRCEGRSRAEWEQKKRAD